MRGARIIVGTLMVLCGLTAVVLRIRITREPNGDVYGIAFGLGRVVFGLLLALVGVLILLTARRH